MNEDDVRSLTEKEKQEILARVGKYEFCKRCNEKMTFETIHPDPDYFFTYCFVGTEKWDKRLEESIQRWLQRDIPYCTECRHHIAEQLWGRSPDHKGGPKKGVTFSFEEVQTVQHLLEEKLENFWDSRDTDSDTLGELITLCKLHWRLQNYTFCVHGHGFGVSQSPFDWDDWKELDDEKREMIKEAQRWARWYEAEMQVYEDE